MFGRRRRLLLSFLGLTAALLLLSALLSPESSRANAAPLPDDVDCDPDDPDCDADSEEERRRR